MSQPSRAKTKPKHIILSILLGGFIIWAFVFNDSDTLSAQPAQPAQVSTASVVTLSSGETIDFIDATIICEGMVKDRLVSPSSAKFPGVFGGNTNEPRKIANAWNYTVVVDSENGFGAMLRSQWLCVLNGDDGSSSVAQLDS